MFGRNSAYLLAWGALLGISALAGVREPVPGDVAARFQPGGLVGPHPGQRHVRALAVAHQLLQCPQCARAAAAGREREYFSWFLRNECFRPAALSQTTEVHRQMRQVADDVTDVLLDQGGHQLAEECPAELPAELLSFLSS